MGANIVNTKSISVSWCLYVLSNTYATFDAQFMKKLSNTQAELKKRCLKELGVIKLFYLHCFGEKPLGEKWNSEILNWSKMFCKINQDTLTVSNNDHSSWKSLLSDWRFLRICWGNSESCFIYGFAFQACLIKIIV